jgi:signal transduction histidine kinase
VSLDWPDSIQIDSLQQAQTLFYCVQEASTNTLKHARASRLSIKARSQDGQLDIWVEDNGHPTTAVVPGNGIKGMQERMTAIAGALDWQAGESGVIVHLNMPLSMAPQ